MMKRCCDRIGAPTPRRGAEWETLRSVWYKTGASGCLGLSNVGMDRTSCAL